MVSRVEEQIYNCIDNGQSFILDAGAGSGKTWTLIQTLKYIISQEGSHLKKNHQKIVCITYTNVAKDEIKERLEYNELVLVNTIHEFIWFAIKQYQRQLKEKFLEYLDEKIKPLKEEIADLEQKIQDAKAKKKGTKTNEKNLNKTIEKLKKLETAKEGNYKEIIYRQYINYKEGIISHDEVLILAKKLFTSFPKINKIIADAFPVILIDEYQDTSPLVIELLCDYLDKQDNFLLGFYGDKMQKIYDEGIGEIPNKYGFQKITKTENFRCSKNVIELLNKIRTDIKQYPAGNNKEGSVNFYIYNSTEKENFDINIFIRENIDASWKKDDESKLKILYLTHRFIARENGYIDIFNLYNSKENPSYRRAACITDNKNNKGCAFANFLFQIEEIYSLYENNHIQTLLKKIDFPINSFEDRNKIKTLLKDFKEIRNSSIDKVISFVTQKELIKITDDIDNFDYEDANNQSFYDDLMKLDYEQFTKLYKIQQDNMPFSTKHGTKGDEFKNVLVVIDDDAWKTEYNFNNYFEGEDKRENRFNRTKNLFYVVCSRAINNLYIINLTRLSDKAKDTINGWFGEDNVHEI